MINNKMEIDIKKIHCKFFEQFILNEWKELRDSRMGLEVARWRVLFWLERWEKDIQVCSDCRIRLLEIENIFLNAGIKLRFEPEIHFK
ncbi:MAG: hypothetical protein I3274_07025 [Candidatus Moeniiplasma glomeromycotorum]|nr:hypothetical protein [Candidatus Moeniiplasma glomeromycotorum]